MSGIYAIAVNGKLYVGSSKDMENRRGRHWDMLRWLERVVDHVGCGCGCGETVEVKQHQTHASYIKRAGPTRYVFGHRARKVA